MRVREWAVAGAYRDPADYGIPELPDWKTCRLDCGGLAFADADGEVFIVAEDPATVRR